MVTSYVEKARAYHTAVSTYDSAQVEAMVREDYIQHNPKVPTGRAPFLALLPRLREHNSRIENQRIFQDGPHVIMHHLWRNAIPFGADQKVAFHIIRFDNQGLIAEHWSVMTDVAPLNPSGRSLIDGPATIQQMDESANNKKRVSELFASLTETKSESYPEIYRHFFLPDFRQHHPDVADGISGVTQAILTGKLDLSYTRQHKVFGSGNFVLSISEGILSQKPTAFYDLFRMENGMIAEHWPVYQEIPTTDLANNNTMFNL